MIQPQAHARPQLIPWKLREILNCSKVPDIYILAQSSHETQTTTWEVCKALGMVAPFSQGHSPWHATVSNSASYFPSLSLCFLTYKMND